MNEFYKGYILAYFKEHKNEYSFQTIAEKLGRPISEIDDHIESLIQEGLLQYDDNHMLRLSSKGRLSILNKTIDFYGFENNTTPMKFINPESALSAEIIYIPKNFISKLK